MRYHRLALVLIFISIASGQLSECNPANNTTTNTTEAARASDNAPNSLEAVSSGIINPEAFNRDIGVTLDVFEADNDTTHIFDLNLPERAKYEVYKIEVRNKGEVQIDGVTLSAVLAKGMFFMNSSYSDASRGKLIAKVDPQLFDKNLETNVRWNLGSLAPEEIKIVIMALYLKPDIIASNVAITVTGTAIDGTRLTDSQGTANVLMPDCGYFDQDAEGNYTIPLMKGEVLAGLHPDAKEICPTIRTPEPVVNTPVQDSKVIDLNFEVMEIGRESARFGIGKKEPAKHEMYKISITNKGDSRIKDVVVSAEMQEDMKFESTRYYEDNRGRLDVTRNPIDFKNGKKTKLTWDIGMLEPEERISILLEAYIKPEANSTHITVNITGKLNGIEERASEDYAKPARCEYKNKNDGNPCDVPSETCKLAACPDWSNPELV
jgi:uncharacterized repeat protein (TIGR01451 family)